jgi:hypothetical protein
VASGIRSIRWTPAFDAGERARNDASAWVLREGGLNFAANPRWAVWSMPRIDEQRLTR